MGVPTSEIRLLKLGADEETIFRSIFVPKTLKEKMIVPVYFSVDWHVL